MILAYRGNQKNKGHGSRIFSEVFRIFIRFLPKYSLKFHEKIMQTNFEKKIKNTHVLQIINGNLKVVRFF